MTPTTKEIREKADIVLGRFGCHRADCRDLARFALEQTAEEGEEPVTDHWLKSIGFAEVFDSEVPDYLMHDEHGELRMKLYQCGNVFTCEEPEWPYDIAARQQVLDLMKCLDIQPKRKEAERCN